MFIWPRNDANDMALERYWNFTTFTCFNIFPIRYGFWTIFKVPRFLLFQGNRVLYFSEIWVSYCQIIKTFLHYSKLVNCTSRIFFIKHSLPWHEQCIFCGICVSYCPRWRSGTTFVYHYGHAFLVTRYCFFVPL